jgi:hypothetical protein
MGNEAEGVPADEEAKAIWLTKLPASRVLPYGKKVKIVCERLLQTPIQVTL